MKWPKDFERYDQDQVRVTSLPQEIVLYKQDRQDQDPVGLIKELGKYGYDILSVKAKRRFDEPISSLPIESSTSSTHRRSYETITPPAALPSPTDNYLNQVSVQQPTGLSRIAGIRNRTELYEAPQAAAGVPRSSFAAQVESVLTPRVVAGLDDVGDQQLRAVSMRFAPADLDNASELVRRRGTNRTYEVRRALRDARWLDDQVQAGATVWVEVEGQRTEVRFRD